MRIHKNPVIFPDSQAALCALRVPSGATEKRDALRILKTLGEYMGFHCGDDHHQGKFRYFEGRRSSGRHVSAEDGSPGERLNWFAIAGPSVGAFKEAARYAARGNLGEMTTKVSMSKVDKKSLASASNNKTSLNCKVCTMSLLDADDPQFEDKVGAIARVCHGGDLEPCSCRV